MTAPPENVTLAEVRAAIAKMDDAERTLAGCFVTTDAPEMARRMDAAVAEVNRLALAYCRAQPAAPVAVGVGGAVAWREDTPYGVGYRFADELLDALDAATKRGLTRPASEAVFACARCPVSVESRWLEPECPECGDPCQIDPSAKPLPPSGHKKLLSQWWAGAIDNAEYFNRAAKLLDLSADLAAHPAPAAGGAGDGSMLERLESSEVLFTSIHGNVVNLSDGYGNDDDFSPDEVKALAADLLSLAATAANAASEGKKPRTFTSYADGMIVEMEEIEPKDSP